MRDYMRQVAGAGIICAGIGGMYLAERLPSLDHTHSPDLSSPVAFVTEETLALRDHYASGRRSPAVEFYQRTIGAESPADGYSTQLHGILGLAEIASGILACGGLVGLVGRKKKE